MLFAGLVSGCAGISDVTFDAAVTDPGKYSPYTCSDFDKVISSTMIRITELEQLIARASQGPGGEVMSAVAYSSELRQARGQVRVMKTLAAEKQCGANDGYLSRRSVY